MLKKRISKAGKRMIATHGQAIASMALSLAAIFSIGTCRFILHQPEEPGELKDYINKN